MAKSSLQNNHAPLEKRVLLAQKGDSSALAALLVEFMPAIRKRAASVHAEGMETDDFIQEGLLALCDAVHRYNPEQGTGFSAYALVCIQNRLLTAVKNAGRQKNIPLSHYLPIDGEEIGDRLSSSEEDPEQMVILREELANLRRQIQNLLSDFERHTLSLYLNGCTYEQMSKRLNSTPKSVDNALQRVRRKLRSSR